MHLGINGWPPLASHVAALLLGLSVANLTTNADPAPKLASRSLVFTLPPQVLAEGRANFAKGSRVHLIRRQVGLSPCRLSREPLTLLAVTPLPLVGTNLAAADELGGLSHLPHGQVLQLAQALVGEQVALCQSRPKVIYGPS